MSPHLVSQFKTISWRCPLWNARICRAPKSYCVQFSTCSTRTKFSSVLGDSNCQPARGKHVRKKGLNLTSFFNCSSRLSSGTHVHTLPFKVDRYQGVHCDLGEIPDYVTPGEFDTVLKASLEQWKISNKCGVWLQVPMVMGHIIPIAAKYGFEYHHAEGDVAMLALWLRSNMPNKMPPYATHQVGVSGVVLKDNTEEVLVVRDKNRPFKLWKFPGGLADLGEDIGQTAEREIMEETGIKTEFCGILAFRQQHKYPNAFGRSDLFFVCHMNALSFDIIPCLDEIDDCKWIHIDELASDKQTSAITQRIIRLVRIGMHRGFEQVDLKADEFQSVYKGMKFKMYNHWLPKDKEEDMAYSHSMATPEQQWYKNMDRNNSH